MSMTSQETAALFKALADENRVLILRILAGGEQCACVLLENLNISQPTLSHHMKLLAAAGLVRGRKDGKWTHYSLCREGLLAARDYLDSVLPAER